MEGKMSRTGVKKFATWVPVAIAIIAANPTHAQVSNDVFDQWANEGFAAVDVKDEALKSLEGTPNIIKVNDIEVDLAIPDSPAFSVLNVDPDKAIRPSTARKLAFQLLEGQDDKGSLQTGIALEFNPYLIFGNDVSLYQYRHDRVVRWLSNTQVSIATVKGTNSDTDKSVKGSIGFSTTLWDRGDLRTSDLFEDECIKGDLDAAHDAAIEAYSAVRQRFDAGDQNLRTKDQVRDAIIKAYAENLGPAGAGMEVVETFNKNSLKCRNDVRKKLWNASSFSLGMAPIFFSNDGSFDDFDGEGFAYWASLAYGFEEFGENSILRRNAQLLLHARYHSDEKVLDPANKSNTFIEQDKLTLAGQLRLGLGDLSLFSRAPDKNGKPNPLQGGADWTVFADVAYVEEDQTGLVDETLFRYTVGAELPIDKGTYFKLSFGTEDGRERGEDEGFIVGRLKFNLSRPD